MRRYLLLQWACLVLIMLPTFIRAQALVIQEEGFESVNIFPSPGWRPQKAVTNISGAFVAQTFAGSTNPTVGAPPGGLLRGMMLNSFTANLNDTSYIISKPFDFSNNGGTNPQMSFYMYRDNGFAAADDHIRVYINTVPSRTGATLLSNTLGSNKMSRYFATVPAATANTWNQYTYDLPAATYNGRRYYFIIEGVCRDGNNLYMDRFAVNTYPGQMNAADVSLNLFFQNPASVGNGVDRQVVVGVRCIVGGTSGCGNISLGTALKLDSLLFNTNGTTNVSDIDDAKVYYTGGSNLFDTTYVSPFPVTAGTGDYPSRRYGQTIAVPGTNLDFVNSVNSCFNLEYDTTYFWLAYDVENTATAGNFVDADFRRGTVGGTAGTCPSPQGTGVTVTPGPGGFSIPGASKIDLPYCVGTYTVGTSGLNGSYTNNDYIQSVVLNGAFGTAINTNTPGGGMPATQPFNNNFGLPSNLPCLLSNGGPGCDFSAQPLSYELWPAVAGRTVVLIQGTAYTMTVQAGTWFSQNNIAAWIDYNGNGVFDDPSERLGGAGFQVSLLANQSGNINFTVPANSLNGLTRMRVREVFATTNIQPCLQYTYGEIEDFQIYISPICPVGYKLWLGYTDDWNNPGNWCGGVPGITDDAIIDAAQVFPPAGTHARPYFIPTIKSGISANCNNLTISANDTLLINSSTPAANALKVRRDLTNNGRIEVISSLPAATKVTYGNGTLLNNIYTPFKSQSTDARTQIIYTRAELAQAGLIAGDRITAIEFTLNQKGSTAPFNGFTISYSLVPFTDHPAPPNPAPFAGPFTNAFGPVAFSTVFPGVNTITLSNPIVWDGTNNLLIQMCFDNASNIGSTDDRINITQTTGRRSTLIYSTTTNAASGCALSSGAGVTDNFYSSNSSFRPNFTFVLNRPYGKAIINVQEDWINNNTFVARNSQVLMDSTVAQTIGGTQNTTFNELRINKAAASQTVSMLRPVLIDSSLILTQGQLRMNTNTLTMNNPAVSGGTVLAPTGPFTRTAGFLISESATASVIWKNITTNGWRNIPFGTLAASPVYIPYSLALKSGGALGDFAVSTYYAPANLPLPPTVTHINSTTGTNNATATTDRYWIVSKTGATPVVDLTFRYSNAAPSERPTGISALNPGRAQPWRTGSPGQEWVRLNTPFTSVTYIHNYGVSATFDSVRVVNFDWPQLPLGQPPFSFPAGPLGNNNPWAITVNNSPLGGPSVSLPQVVVSSLINESCPGGNDGAISITVSGGSPPYSYQWSNGSTSANLNGISAGTYTVVVTDANGSTGTASATVGLSGQTPSTPGPINGPSVVCRGNSVTMVVPPAQGASAYQWSVPAGASISSGQGTNTVIIFFSNSYNGGQVCVSATNACGITPNSCLTVGFSSGLPASPDSVTGPAQICPGDTIVYSTNTTTNTLSYVWTVPTGMSIISGTSTNSVLVSVGPSFSSGTVSVASLNACGLSLITRNKNVTRKPVPATPSSIQGNANGVCNSTRTYSVTNVPGVLYTWTVPSGATLLSGQGSSAISVAFNSTFSSGPISVTAANACGTSNVRSRTIFGRPVQPAFISGPLTFCLGDTVQFTGSFSSGATSYTWLIPAGLSIVSGQGTRFLKVTGSGAPVTGDVCMRAVNSCGSSANRCITISAQPSASSISAVNGNGNGVCNSTRTYSVATQQGITFTWTVPSGANILSGQGSNSISVNFSSSYTTGDVTVTATGPCGSNATAFKTVNGAPASPAAITGPTSVCFNAQNVSYTASTVSGATSYTWTLPSGVSVLNGQGTSAIALNFATTAGGAGQLRVRANNACGSSANRSVTVNYLSCPRLNQEEPFGGHIQLYPNPAQTEVVVEWQSEEDGEVLLSLLNVLGQHVQEHRIIESRGVSRVLLPLSHLADGVYFVQLRTVKGDTQTQRLVISK